nr:MAG TPA: tail tape measure [Caudoviricetes sp.]
MSTANIDTKVKMDGEREYKAALAEIKSGLNVLKSELNLTSEQFRDNADSVEALTAKNDILDRTILTQKEKIEEIKKALQSAAETYGEANEKTQRWQTQLNSAQAELLKMERALDENSKALEEAQEKSSFAHKAMETLQKAAEGVKTGFHGLASAGKKVVSAAGDIGKALASVAAAATATTAALATGFAAAVVKAEQSMVSMTQEAAAYADNILTMSQTTGLSTNALQEFAYATELIDVSMDTLQGSMTKMTNNMQNAVVKGTGDAKTAFAQLGVTLTNTDGSMRSANDVFYNTIDALGTVQNVTERDALSMDIFGKSAQDLNPLIIQGSETLREYAKEAHEMGAVLDTEALNALGAVDDSFQRLQQTQDALKRKLAVEFAPYLVTAMQNLMAMLDRVGTRLRTSGLMDTLGELLTTVSELLEPAGEMLESILPSVNDILSELAPAISSISDKLSSGMARALNMVKDLIEKVGKAIDESGAVEAFDKILDVAIGLIDPLGDILAALLPPIVDLVNDIAPVLSTIAEKLADVLPDAIQTLISFIDRVGKALEESGANEAFDKLLDAALDLLDPMTDLLEVILPPLADLLKIIAPIVDTIADGLQLIVGILTLNGDKIKEALGLTTDVWSGGHNTANPGQGFGGGRTTSSTANEEILKKRNPGGLARYASGADWFPGGRTLLSEHGAETAILPQGTRILTAQETREYGGDTYNITIDARSVREFEDILRIVQDRRRIVRMGGAG